MNIKKIAIANGAIVYKYDPIEYSYPDDYTFTEPQLEQFAKAVLAEFVKEQKPVSWIYTGTDTLCSPVVTLNKTRADIFAIGKDDIQPLFTLEVKA